MKSLELLTVLSDVHSTGSVASASWTIQAGKPPRSGLRKHMNWRWSVTAALVLSALTFPSLSAAQSFYGAVTAGYGIQASDANPYGENIAVDSDFPGTFGSGDGVAGAVAIGYFLSEKTRLEGRVGFHRGSFSETAFGTGARTGEEYILDGNIKSTTFTLEGFYDLPVARVIPYLKAGIGVSSNSYSARLGGAGVADFDPFDGTADGYYDAYSDETTAALAWNVGVGVSTALSSRFDIFAEYQFIALGDAETGQDDFTDGFRIDGASAHEGLVGIRVRLGSTSEDD